MTTYTLGNIVRLWATFLDVNDQLTDPALVYLIVNKSGEYTAQYQYPTDPSIVRTATGTFYFDALLDREGGWNYYWHSSGTNSASRGQLIVEGTGV